MNFVTLDFETANNDPSSACEIGLTVVQHGQIQQTHQWLIRPPQNSYNYHNIRVHGIQPSDTLFMPDFRQLWPTIRPIIHQQWIIAHNAPFDISVLRHTLAFYQLQPPTLHFACSYRLVKKIWPHWVKHDLKTACNQLNIQFNHHRAGDDSKAAAALTIQAFQHAGIDSMERFTEVLGTIPGHLSPQLYYGFKTKPTRSKKHI